MKKSILYLLLLLNITLVVINTYCDDNLKIKNIEAWAVKIEEVLYNENNLENIFTLIPLDQPPSYEKLWFIKILIKGFKFEMQEAGIFSSETLKYEGEIKDIQKTVNGGIEIEIYLTKGNGKDIVKFSKIYIELNMKNGVLRYYYDEEFIKNTLLNIRDPFDFVFEPIIERCIYFKIVDFHVKL